MADNPVLDRVSGFAAQPITRQLSLLAGFAASVALAIGVVNWASTPSFEPVYGAMSPADNDGDQCSPNERHQIPHGTRCGALGGALRRRLAGTHGLGERGFSA